MRPRQFESATTGFDDGLQLIGGDPMRGTSSVGLRVPSLPTPATQAGLLDRYLNLLAIFSVGESACVRIRGFRQLVTIGTRIATTVEGTTTFRDVEQLVTSPFWRFPDGNISWHLHLLGPPNAQGLPTAIAPAVDLPSFKLLMAEGPALLYGPGQPPVGDGIYTDLGAYVAANGGRPPGVPIDAHLGTFYDLKTQWQTHGAWYSLDIPVRGPETIAFFASVRQTNPNTRTVIVPPNPFFPAGLSSEEQFLLNFPAAQYWRVGGALIVEEE